MLPNPPAYGLEIRGLVKRFDRPAVDGLDLAVRAGEFYALLGPNGAGKTLFVYRQSGGVEWRPTSPGRPLLLLDLAGGGSSNVLPSPVFLLRI